jgi:hypothetical protein
MTRLFYAFLVPLMACAPVPDDIEPIPLDDGAGGVVIDSTSGLQERLPDTCGLSNYEGFVGQTTAAVIIPPEANTRVVQPGEILSQIYVADRVNFYVDGQGVITRIICG